MPHQAGTELRAQEGRPRAVHQARGKIVAGASEPSPASEITIIVPDGGVAMMDGTSITDAALARKLAAAVKKNAAIKVKLAYAETARARAQAVEALVKRAGATNIELSIPAAAPAAKLVIAANGAITLDARRVTDAQLDAELAALAKRTKQLALTADKATPYIVVVKLMDRATAAGLTEIMFVAAP